MVLVLNIIIDSPQSAGLPLHVSYLPTNLLVGKNNLFVGVFNVWKQINWSLKGEYCIFVFDGV